MFKAVFRDTKTEQQFCLLENVWIQLQLSLMPLWLNLTREQGLTNDLMGLMFRSHNVLIKDRKNGGDDEKFTD